MKSRSRPSLMDRMERALKSLTAFGAYHPERHYMRGPGPKCASRQLRAGRPGAGGAQGRP